MEKENQEYHDLIARHLKGECSPFEERLLAEWIQESEEHQALYEELSVVWDKTSAIREPLPDTESAWNKVKQQTGIGSEDAEETIVRQLEWRSYLRVAAMLLLVAGLGYLLRTVWFTKDDRTLIVAGNEKKEIILPDSSRVWLNKNTRLSYSGNYNDRKREVHLEGEAFFEVRRDKTRPFIVSGIRSVTEVLGTSFNVRALKGASSETVEVVTGKVSVSATGERSDKVVLYPGEQAVALSDGTIERSGIKDPNFLSWKSRRLQFSDTPLSEVAKAMEEYFHVGVVIQNKELQNCRFTGDFENPDATMLLKVLSVSLNLSYTKEGNAYVLRGQGCQ